MIIPFPNWRLLCASLLALTSVACTPPTSSTTPPAPTNFYLIALEADGKDPIGCNDALVAVPLPNNRNATLREALIALLALKDSHPGGLYNALYRSTLALDKVTIKNHHATVHLSGITRMGGVCDIPRVKAQLEATVLQFVEIETVTILINGKTMDEALRMKGGVVL